MNFMRLENECNLAIHDSHDTIKPKSVKNEFPFYRCLREIKANGNPAYISDLICAPFTTCSVTRQR